MVLTKEMYKCLNDIKKFIAKNGSRRLDGKLLNQFVVDRYSLIVQLEQSDLIYRTQHEFSIKGPGYMAMEYYEQTRSNKNIQKLLLLITACSFIVACAAIYISYLVYQSQINNLG